MALTLSTAATMPRSTVAPSSTPTPTPSASGTHRRSAAARRAPEAGCALQNDFLGGSTTHSLSASASSTRATAAADCRRRPLVVEAAKRKSSARNLVLSSTLIAEAGREEQVAKLCQSVLQMADEKKKAHPESGIMSFECSTDAYDKNVVHFWERYDSFLAMNDFHASPQYTQFLEQVRPMLTSPVLLAAYEYKDGQIGCMLNPIGPKGEGGLDDATGQGGSGGGASYKQTSQSLQQGIGERDAWGMEQALDISKTRSAAQEAAAAIAQSLRSIFGGKKEQK